jgi:hypothetical protein
VKKGATNVTLRTVLYALNAIKVTLSAKQALVLWKLLAMITLPVSFVLSLGPSSITLAKSAIPKVTVYNVPMRTLIFVFNVNLVSISSTTLVSPVRTTA